MSNSDLQAPGPKEPLRRVVDSTLAIAFARVFMPVALAIIGYFMTTAVSDMKSQIRDGNAAIWVAVKEVAEKVNTQATDVAVLKQSRDETAKAVDRLTAIIDKLNSKP